MENYKEITIIGSLACMWDSEWEHKFTYTIIYLNEVRISAPVTLWSQRSQITSQKRLKEKDFNQSVVHCYNTTCTCYISETSFLKTEIRLRLMFFNSLQNTAHSHSHCCSTAVREISFHLKMKKNQNGRKQRKCQKHSHYKFALVNLA